MSIDAFRNTFKQLIRENTRNDLCDFYKAGPLDAQNAEAMIQFLIQRTKIDKIDSLFVFRDELQIGYEIEFQTFRELAKFVNDFIVRSRY